MVLLRATELQSGLPLVGAKRTRRRLSSLLLLLHAEEVLRLWVQPRRRGALGSERVACTVLAWVGLVEGLADALADWLSVAIVSREG